MGKANGRGVLLVHNLPALRSLLKRDPVAYRDEFFQQYNHYLALKELLLQQDHQDTSRIVGLGTGSQSSRDKDAQRLGELINFVAHVAPIYPSETTDFPQHLKDMLESQHSILGSELRKTIIHAWVLLVNRKVITTTTFLQVLLPVLTSTPSKALREDIYKTIINAIKIANQHGKNHKINSFAQGVLYTMVEQGLQPGVSIHNANHLVGKSKKANRTSAVAPGSEATWAIKIARELWRKGLWTDEKTVGIMTIGCLHPHLKVQIASIHFFLNTKVDDEEESDSDTDLPDLKQLQKARLVNGKKHATDKLITRAKKLLKKRRHASVDLTLPNHAALNLLYNPQGLSEQIYENLVKNDKKYSLELKVLIMQLLGRLVGSTKSFVLGWYSYVIKYLSPRQLSVPSILAALAQSVHSLTPPENVEPVIKKLANEFVTAGVAPEVMAAGLNTIREISRRQPLAMDGDLLNDLVMYRRSKDKAVTSAARGLLKLFRDVRPGLLAKKERGKATTIAMKDATDPGQFEPVFGQDTAGITRIEGLARLDAALKAEFVGEGNLQEEARAPSDDGWDVVSDDEGSSDPESSDGWQNVDSDGDEDIYLSDSESDDGTAKRIQKRSLEDDDDAATSSNGKKVRFDSPDADAKAREEEERAEAEARYLATAEADRLSTLATTKILTPADFARLQSLRDAALGEDALIKAGGKRKDHSKKAAAGMDDADFLTEQSILGPQKHTKMSRAERIASVESGREGRDMFTSKIRRAHKKPEGASKSNKEKRHTKSMMMMVHKREVVGKGRRSLANKQKALRKHVVHQKKSHH